MQPMAQMAAPMGGAVNPAQMAQMAGPMGGSLTGLIKVAIQSSTNEIQNNFRQELNQMRNELFRGIDGKANKSELLALAQRLDSWNQKSKSRGVTAAERHLEQQRAERYAEKMEAQRDRAVAPREVRQERSLSPRHEAETSMREPRDSFKQSSPAATMAKSASASGIFSKEATGVASPSLLDRKKPSCHEKCKEPTCPKSDAMQRSLSRL